MKRSLLTVCFLSAVLWTAPVSAGLFCQSAAECDDGDPCNGAEACAVQTHTCKPGTPLADGASCGMAKICRKGVCGDVRCGDGIPTAPEECDDGNMTAGDGCENDCRFTCVSTDMKRNCVPADICAGRGTCVDMVHRCMPGLPLADGTPCGALLACMKGVCVKTLCGNGMLDPGEICDDGNQIAGDGCETTCVYTCANPVNDCKQAAPLCNAWTCNVKHLCEAAPDMTKNGTVCGMGLICKAGVCTTPNAACGNGMVEPGEECDFGGGNGAGVGCEKNCRFSCTRMPDSCPDMNVCNGVEACAPVMVNGQAGQKCNPGMNAADGTACGMGSICLTGQCKASTCGDGFVDKAKGEQCEPPNSMTCDANCFFKASCGNGRRENGEQCDDSNMTNLDGCSNTCKFEQSQRINWFKMQFNTDAYCTANAFGAAVVNNLAQGQLQMALDGSVQDGSTSILFAALGLTDLTGANQPMFNLGVLNGGALNTMGNPTMYNGTADLDWWYKADPLSIDMARSPTAKLPASIANAVLNAGPGSVSINLLLTGGVTPLKMSNVKVQTSIGASNVPKVSMNMLPPGHVPAENLDPMLTSFGASGQPNANGAGKLCGNVAAASLAKIPLPAAVVQQCNQYTVNNTMLDIVVGGCTAFGFLQLIRPTQPDKEDANVAPVGAGPPYTLSATQGKAVNTCKDRTGAVVNLAMCLDDAAYSSYFKFTTDRVIIK